ncbi:hypothetical protein ACFWPU_01940 [Streptomyces sp. NPDC058471]|uniref:hypothetical protein n=1 Tax=Streptomyces sp. NPDC058471 TaxID=3346516 RepID=UPI003649E503
MSVPSDREYQACRAPPAAAQRGESGAGEGRQEERVAVRHDPGLTPVHVDDAHLVRRVRLGQPRIGQRTCARQFGVLLQLFARPGGQRRAAPLGVRRTQVLLEEDHRSGGGVLALLDTAAAAE